STSLATSQPIRIPDVAGAPQQTDNIFNSFNVDARLTNIGDDGATPPGSNFDPDSPSTYSSSTSATVYDSLGESHTVTQYFVKRGGNEWDVYTTFDGQLVDMDVPAGNEGATAADGVTTSQRIRFDSAGNPDVTPPEITFPQASISLAGNGPDGDPYLANGADDTQTININFQDRTGSEVP